MYWESREHNAMLVRGSANKSMVGCLICPWYGRVCVVLLSFTVQQQMVAHKNNRYLNEFVQSLINIRDPNSRAATTMVGLGHERQFCTSGPVWRALDIPTDLLPPPIINNLSLSERHTRLTGVAKIHHLDSWGHRCWGGRRRYRAGIAPNSLLQHHRSSNWPRIHTGGLRLCSHEIHDASPPVLGALLACSVSFKISCCFCWSIASPKQILATR